MYKFAEPDDDIDDEGNHRIIKINRGNFTIHKINPAYKSKGNAREIVKDGIVHHFAPPPPSKSTRKLKYQGKMVTFDTNENEFEPIKREKGKFMYTLADITKKINSKKNTDSEWLKLKLKDAKKHRRIGRAKPLKRLTLNEFLRRKAHRKISKITRLKAYNPNKKMIINKNKSKPKYVKVENVNYPQNVEYENAPNFDYPRIRKQSHVAKLPRLTHKQAQKINAKFKNMPNLSELGPDDVPIHDNPNLYNNGYEYAANENDNYPGIKSQSHNVKMPPRVSASDATNINRNIKNINV